MLEELKRSPFVTRHEIKSAQAMGQDAEKVSFNALRTYRHAFVHLLMAANTQYVSAVALC